MNTIKHIRTKILDGMSQADFAAAIGKPQPTVSRWEREGTNMRPDLADLNAIRALVVGQGRDWSDKWFFEVPAESTAA